MIAFRDILLQSVVFIINTTCLCMSIFRCAAIFLNALRIVKTQQHSTGRNSLLFIVVKLNSNASFCLLLFLKNFQSIFIFINHHLICKKLKENLEIYRWKVLIKCLKFRVCVILTALVNEDIKKVEKQKIMQKRKSILNKWIWKSIWISLKIYVCAK